MADNITQKCFVHMHPLQDFKFQGEASNPAFNCYFLDLFLLFFYYFFTFSFCKFLTFYPLRCFRITITFLVYNTFLIFFWNHYQLTLEEIIKTWWCVIMYYLISRQSMIATMQFQILSTAYMSTYLKKNVIRRKKCLWCLNLNDYNFLYIYHYFYV